MLLNRRSISNAPGTRIEVKKMLVIDKNLGYSYGYEQVGPGEARSNPLDALRGQLHAVNFSRGGRVDQPRLKAAR